MASLEPKYLVRKVNVHAAISSEFEFPQNGLELGSVAQELGIRLVVANIRAPWCSKASLQGGSGTETLRARGNDTYISVCLRRSNGLVSR